MSIILPSVVLTAGLALSVLNDAFIETAQRRHLLVICGLVFVLIVQNHVELLLTTRYAYDKQAKRGPAKNGTDKSGA